MRIKTAIIPAAGLGTRFLPFTKIYPKEVLPIVDVPTLQLIIEEAARSGISKIILVISKQKMNMADHFKPNLELESHLENIGKKDLAQLSKNIGKGLEIQTVVQDQALGLGHAVLCTQAYIKEEAFALMLGDDLMDCAIPCTQQLISVYEKYQKSVVAVMQVNADQVSKYGVISGNELNHTTWEVNHLVEKPSPELAPSLLALPGRYILKTSVFKPLEQLFMKMDRSQKKELQLTDALCVLAENKDLIATRFEGIRFDTGDRLGYLEACIHYALKRPELSKGLYEYMSKVIQQSKTESTR